MKTYGKEDIVSNKVFYRTDERFIIKILFVEGNRVHYLYTNSYGKDFLPEFNKMFKDDARKTIYRDNVIIPDLLNWLNRNTHHIEIFKSKVSLIQVER